MVKRPRRTQAQEVIRMFKREGFMEIPPEKISEELNRTIYALPRCFEESGKKCTRRRATLVKDKVAHYSKKNPLKK